MLAGVKRVQPSGVVSGALCGAAGILHVLLVRDGDEEYSAIVQLLHIISGWNRRTHRYGTRILPRPS
jgi:hypothetical protein